MKKSLLMLFLISEILVSNSFNIDCENSKSIKIKKSIYESLDGEECKTIKYKSQTLLFYYLNGMVNQCGKLLKADKSNEYSEYFLSSEVCNIKLIKNVLISAYRDQAQWIYHYFLIGKKGKVQELYSLTPKTLTQYNDIAYYLQKAGANKEAVYLLEKIIKKFPNRTVAYINLGDAYWELGEKEKARQAYTTYIEQMCNKGLQKKIPHEVLKRVERKDVCQ